MQHGILFLSSAALVAATLGCSSDESQAEASGSASGAGAGATSGSASGSGGGTGSGSGGAPACPGGCPDGTACDAGECKPAAWSQVTPPTDRSLWGVWGSASDDVWAVGDSGVILHYDGTEWLAVTSPRDDPTTSSMYGVWGTASDNVWAVGSPSPHAILHFDGRSWTTVVPYPTDGVLTDVWGSSETDVFAVGAGFGKARLLHYDGAEWVSITKTTTPDNGGLDIDGGFGAVWGSGEDAVWAAGEAGVYRYEGDWQPYADAPAEDVFMGMHGSAADDVWLAAESFVDPAPDVALYHFDGSAWSAAPYPEGGYITDVWSFGDGEVWAVGEGEMGGIFHLKDGAWSVPESAAEARGLKDIFAVSPADMWAVGQDGIMWHWAVVR